MNAVVSQLASGQVLFSVRYIFCTFMISTFDRGNVKLIWQTDFRKELPYVFVSSKVVCPLTGPCDYLLVRVTR